jgi:hypothetical protein
MTAYLNPRLIATHGFALTPIAMAVQGLLAILADEEKRSQVYGSGRKLAVPPDWNTAPIREPLQGPIEDDGLVDKVLEKWAAIEAAQAARPGQALQAVPKPVQLQKSIITPGVKVDTSPKLSTLKAKPIAAIPALDDAFTLKAEQDRRNAEQITLILALAEAL